MLARPISQPPSSLTGWIFPEERHRIPVAIIARRLF